MGCHDGPVLAQQAVEEARLACVGLARDHDPRPFPGHAAFAVACRQPPDPRRDVSEPIQQRVPRGRFDAVFLLEVDFGLQQREDVEEGGAQLPDRARQVAPEMPESEVEPPL